MMMEVVADDDDSLRMTYYEMSVERNDE